MRRTGIIVSSVVVLAIIAGFAVNALAQDSSPTTGKPARTITVSSTRR